MIEVDLPYPHAYLWPNRRPATKQAASARVSQHRTWAFHATMADPAWRSFVPGASVPVHIIVSRKAAGVYPDRDNTVAAAKAYLDGIADRLGFNDRLFAAPTVEFIPLINGRFLFQIGGATR